MRREREAPWSSPVFPYLGWIILGWVLTWAAVELNMLQRLLDTDVAHRRAVGRRASPCRSSRRRSSAIDKAIQLRRHTTQLTPTTR